MIEPIVVFGLATAAIIGLVTFGIARDRARDRRFESAGARLGLRFERRRQEIDRARQSLAGLPCMTREDRHALFRVLLGEGQIVCDWRVLARPKQRPRRFTQTLVAQSRAGLDLPRFRMVAAASERWLSERDLGVRVALDDDPASPAEGVAIAGPDPDRLRHFFSPSRRARIRMPAEIVVEGEGDWIACYRPRHKIAANELAPFLEEVRVLFDAILDD